MKSYKTKNFLNTMSEYDWIILSRGSTTLHTKQEITYIQRQHIYDHEIELSREDGVCK